MSDSIFQNSGCTNTILGSLNQLCAFLPLPYTPDLTTILNRKYGILPDIEPTSIPKLMYFGIGINGYVCDTGTNGMPEHHKRLPDGRNMDLYCPIPFRMVTLDNDLTPEERSHYRMRAVKTIKHGSEEETYVCYYLKLIDWDSENVQILRINPDGTESNYIFDDSYLRPEPREVATTGGAEISQDRIIVRAVGKCAVTKNELREAMSILYNIDYCTISEFGFYTGEEVYVNDREEYKGPVDDDHADLAGNNIEAAYVQLAKHKTQMPVTLDGSNSELETQISFEVANSISI